MPLSGLETLSRLYCIFLIAKFPHAYSFVKWKIALANGTNALRTRRITTASGRPPHVGLAEPPADGEEAKFAAVPTAAPATRSRRQCCFTRSVEAAMRAVAVQNARPAAFPQNRPKSQEVKTSTETCRLGKMLNPGSRR